MISSKTKDTRTLCVYPLCCTGRMEQLRRCHIIPSWYEDWTRRRKKVYYESLFFIGMCFSVISSFEVGVKSNLFFLIAATQLFHQMLMPRPIQPRTQIKFEFYYRVRANTGCVANVGQKICYLWEHFFRVLNLYQHSCQVNSSRQQQ